MNSWSPAQTRRLRSHLAKWSQPSQLKNPGEIALHFCPDLRRAAFLITDHGDRTQLPISRAIYFGHSDFSHREYGVRGLCPTGIRVTQAALYKGYPQFDYLGDPAFLSMLKDAYHAGIEVCPHNTCDHMDISPEETREHIEIYAREFGLTSWIDHFRLETNFSRKGMDPHSQYFIFDLFKQHGGRIAWSFIDRYANAPHGELNLMRPPTLRGYLQRAAREIWSRKKGQGGTTRLRARIGSALLAILGGRSLSNLFVLGYPPAETGWVNYLKNIFGFPINTVRHWTRLLIRSGLSDYPVRWDEDNHIYWFDSARVLFVSESYNSRALSELVEQNGIHIGHTYLGLEDVKYFDRAFESTSHGDYRVADSFQNFLDNLATKIRSRDVWNPTLRELARFYDDLSEIELVRSENGYLLVNHSNRPIAGVTIRATRPLMMSPSRPAESRAVQSEVWYSLELGPRESVSLCPT